MKSSKGFAAALIAGAAVVLGNVGATAIGYFGGNAAVRAGITYLADDDLRDFKAGFEDVSAEAWDSWIRVWEDSSETTMRKHAARAAMQYSTKGELLALFRQREQVFRWLAEVPGAGPVCADGVNANIDVDLSEANFEMPNRQVGRVLAREHEGYPAWSPPIDLLRDEAAWQDFGAYLSQSGRGDLLDGLIRSGEANADQQTTCNVMADLYALVANHPDDNIGSLNLLEFVRSMDMAGLDAGSQ